MTSAAQIIRLYNAQREPERLALKMAAMRETIFSFYRGTAHLFWQRVDEMSVAGSAPMAWCSGDLHLQNFGTYRGDNGLTYFDINDFDEAALAPCDWEVLRLVTSILVACPALGMTKAASKDLAKTALQTYRSELAGGKVRWIERKTATGAIGQLMTDLKKRSLVRMLDRRTVLKKGRRALDMNPARSLPVTAKVRADVERFVRGYGKTMGDPAFYTLLDVARRVSGTASLGLARFSLLVEGAGSPDGNALLDLKAAMPSSLAMISPARQPRWSDEAHRIVAVQQRCQAIAPSRLSAVTFAKQPFVLKQLQPSADRLDLAHVGKDTGALCQVIESMAQLAAWAQLRSAGRDGSVPADALMAFAASDDVWTTRLMTQAGDLAAVISADFKDFCAAP